MSIRRRLDGTMLCAAMFPEMPGDSYIDDTLHYEMSVVHEVIYADPEHDINGLWHWTDVKGVKAEFSTLRQQVAELEKQVYTPGVFRCAKCNLVLVSTNLHVNNGTYSANNEPQQCANGCGPMWRITEREQRKELSIMLESAESKLRKARETLEEAKRVMTAACGDKAPYIRIALGSIEQTLKETS